MALVRSTIHDIMPSFHLNSPAYKPEDSNSIHDDHLPFLLWLILTCACVIRKCVLFSYLVLVKQSFNLVCVTSFDEESEMLKYFKSPFMK